MIKKVCKIILDDIKNNKWFYICLVIISLLFLIKLDYNVHSPGKLISLNDRIIVEDGYDSKGSFNLTYVSSRSGTISNILLSYIIPNWDIEPVDNMRIESEDENEIVERNKLYLRETSYDAIISAFNEAHIEYKLINNNIIVTHVFEEANTDLMVGDIIKSVNGVKVNNYKELSLEIEKYNENDEITLTVLRKDKVIECKSKLFKKNDTVFIGISLSELKNIETNPKVKYVFEDNESGSSRGLMCALEIYNRITEFDLTKGKTISGTGTIDENGVVGAIGGVKYKLLGAYKNKADIFLVPSDNYDEALEVKKDNNLNIDIYSADNLHDVIEYLKNY